MAGLDMLSFVDLGQTALERHPPLLGWVRAWSDRPTLEPLTPEGWFEEGHGIKGGYLDKHKVWIPNHKDKNQMHLWAPQPAVADAALEELLKARHKRTDTFHIVLIPRLMTPRWRRLFNKACDFNFVVSPGLVLARHHVRTILGRCPPPFLNSQALEFQESTTVGGNGKGPAAGARDG